MPAVYWGWHMVDGGAVANAVQNFQHWAIRVGDKWYENDNTGSNATGKPYVVNTLSQSEVQDQLKNRERMAPMKTKKLGESNATEAQITAWMDEYKKGRTYNITASLSWPPSASEKQIGNCQTMVSARKYTMVWQLPICFSEAEGGHDSEAVMLYVRPFLSWPPSASEKQIGNCQTMVYFLADKMGVVTSDLKNSNYNGHDIIKIPSPGPKRNACSVTAGSCTGSLTPFFGGYDSEWCGRSLQQSVDSSLQCSTNKRSKISALCGRVLGEGVSE
eukprot:CAMPEP_0114176488 /NCGR_PEP_ID=MMETSP0043_2-20121206/37517_1 /TAXON_ID=464988 /ORGANISM="Hemiselmis andersenii, Strain CCMP644" /LENGTH=273 /DNA_ID=CAMNT_0001274797 /DNA_START=430 /DNA_END=1251 /DNA_ORIENTATION=+